MNSIWVIAVYSDDGRELARAVTLDRNDIYFAFHAEGTAASWKEILPPPTTGPNRSGLIPLRPYGCLGDTLRLTITKTGISEIPSTEVVN